MTDYKSLIEELKYGAEYGCDYDLIERAAAAIEDLLESVGMLDKQRSYWIDKAAEYYNQLPKRGEWELKGANRVDCSVCGHSICFASVLSKGSLTGYNYCPNCGAKMEVQDA